MSAIDITNEKDNNNHNSSNNNNNNNTHNFHHKSNSNNINTINSDSNTSISTYNYRQQHCTPVLSPVDSIRLFIRNFGIAYGIRSGISVLLRAFHLATTEPRALFHLERLLGESQLQFRTEAVRWGLFVGWTTGGYCMIHYLLDKYIFYNRESDDKNNNNNNNNNSNNNHNHNNNKYAKYSSIVSGLIAGLVAIVHNAEQRRTLALYAMARVFQCCYNEAKRRQYFKPMKHGDSLLFCIASAQIMYAYVMRPETLPFSYWNFIVRSGPIPKEALTAVRMNLRGKKIDVESVKSIIIKAGGGIAKNFVLSETPKRVGCEILHPARSCISHDFNTLVSTFKKTWPLYATLTFVPMAVLRTLQILRRPFHTLGGGLISVSRSALFLSSFCALYQTSICAHHNVFQGDHKMNYYIAGWISSLAIFIEQKKRRSELALYALPRAIDSVYMMMRDYKWLGNVPLGEVWVFCLSLSALMFFYHEHPYDTLSPFLSTSFNFLFKHKKRLVVTTGSLGETPLTKQQEFEVVHQLKSPSLSNSSSTASFSPGSP